MNAEKAYQWLMERSGRSIFDEFDTHVIASILALALSEAEEGGRTLSDGTGLDGAALRALMTAAFSDPDGFADDACVTIDEEERSLRDILLMNASEGSELERHLAAMIARRCAQSHHLWQDLGLRNRGELSDLMTRHFAGLAGRNRSDMKWKKFLYRMVCRSEGFSLCTAPVCSDCDDFADCFGAEDGESLLARLRNRQELVV